MAGRAFFRALEDHVLDEMRYAAELCGFVSAAVADPDADRYRAHIVQTLGDDAHAVWENSFYIHNIRSYISFFLFVLRGRSEAAAPPKKAGEHNRGHVPLLRLFTC